MVNIIFNNWVVNCLFFFIMMYVLVEYVGFNVIFYEVEILEYWIWWEGYSLLNGYINFWFLLLNESFVVVVGGMWVDVDFDL